MEDEYLYKDTGCCLHPCSTFDCPEPLCILEFPGYKKGRERYKLMVGMIAEGLNTDEIAERLNIKKRQVTRWLSKMRKLSII